MKINTSTKLKSSERRGKLQQKLTLVKLTAKEYEQILSDLRAANAQIDKIEAQKEKLLAPLKAAAGIDKLQQQIWDIEGHRDDLENARERFQDLAIDKLAEGKPVTGFELCRVLKRKSCSYKSICEELCKNAKGKLAALMDKFGSRKEQYILRYKNEEVAYRDIQIG